MERWHYCQTPQKRQKVHGIYLDQLSDIAVGNIYTRITNSNEQSWHQMKLLVIFISEMTCSLTDAIYNTAGIRLAWSILSCSRDPVNFSDISFSGSKQYNEGWASSIEDCGIDYPLETMKWRLNLPRSNGQTWLRV